MRIASWNNWTLIAALVAVATQALPAAAQQHPELRLERGRIASNLLLSGAEGASLRVPLVTDATALPRSATSVREVGRVPGRYLVIIDTHASRPQGMRRCQAGEEVWLRVISLGDTPREWQRIKLASCLDNIEAAEPPVSFNAASGTLEIRWIAGPMGGAVRSQTIALVP
jgi:hypothetical protein